MSSILLPPRMSIYLAGPMRGFTRFNFDTFDEVTTLLRSCGHEVFSPAENDRKIFPEIESWDGFETGDITLCPLNKEYVHHTVMRWDLQHITKADGVVFLPHWEASEGSRAERFVAEQTGRKRFLAKRIMSNVWEFFTDNTEKMNGAEIRD